MVHDGFWVDAEVLVGIHEPSARMSRLNIIWSSRPTNVTDPTAAALADFLIEDLQSVQCNPRKNQPEENCILDLRGQFAFRPKECSKQHGGNQANHREDHHRILSLQLQPPTMLMIIVPAEH